MFYFFFFNDTATTEIYTLSLHDALPIYQDRALRGPAGDEAAVSQSDAQPFVAAVRLRRPLGLDRRGARGDRKSTRLNSSHGYVSYAVFCLKKKKKSNSTCHTQITSERPI